MIDPMRLEISGAAPRKQRPVTVGYVGISITTGTVPDRRVPDNAQFAGAQGRRITSAPSREAKAELDEPGRRAGPLRLRRET